MLIKSAFCSPVEQLAAGCARARWVTLRSPRWGPMALAAACLVVSAACGSDEQAAPTAVPARAVQELALLAELQGVDSGEWISIYDPQRAWNGYTLGFYRHRTPILFDMNGRIVHSWPEVNLRSRLRLLTDGSLLGISTGIQLMTREVGADDEQWQEASFELGRWEYQKVELCVQTTALGSAAGQPTAELAFWSSPRIA